MPGHESLSLSLSESRGSSRPNRARWSGHHRASARNCRRGARPLRSQQQPLSLSLSQVPLFLDRGARSKKAHSRGTHTLCETKRRDASDAAAVRVASYSRRVPAPTTPECLADPGAPRPSLDRTASMSTSPRSSTCQPAFKKKKLQRLAPSKTSPNTPSHPNPP